MTITLSPEAEKVIKEAEAALKGRSQLYSRAGDLARSALFAANSGLVLQMIEVMSIYRNEALEKAANIVEQGIGYAEAYEIALDEKYDRPNGKSEFDILAAKIRALKE